ncbi:hypothetical protein M011DRAFT_469689, partial [Sporormia fimetaria CBS 119925]
LVSSDATEHTEHPLLALLTSFDHVTLPRVEVSRLCFPMPFVPHLRSSASRLPGILICS